VASIAASSAAWQSKTVPPQRQAQPSALVVGFGTKKESRAKKLGRVWATYRPVGAGRPVANRDEVAAVIGLADAAAAGSCPPTCKLLIERSCYAMYGRVNLHQLRARLRTFDLAAWLVGLPTFGKVRHNVSGDIFARSRPDMRYIAAMLAGHALRQDLRGWTYTHGWRSLSWLPARLAGLPGLAVNASCDTPADVRDALAAGWPAVTVVPETAIGDTDCGAYIVRVCPQQVRPGVTCASCMLCAMPERARAGRPIVIGFRVHGTGAALAGDRLAAQASTGGGLAERVEVAS
jgi:hypothetical protein